MVVTNANIDVIDVVVDDVFNDVYIDVINDVLSSPSSRPQTRTTTHILLLHLGVIDLLLAAIFLFALFPSFLKVRQGSRRRGGAGQGGARWRPGEEGEGMGGDGEVWRERRNGEMGEGKGKEVS